MNFANAQGVENIYMKNDDKIKPRNFIKKKEKEILHSVLLKRHGIITTKSLLPMYTVCLLFVYDSETEGRGNQSHLLIGPASNQVPWLFFTHEDTMMSE